MSEDRLSYIQLLWDGDLTSFAQVLASLPEIVLRRIADRGESSSGTPLLSPDAYPNAIWAQKLSEYAEFDEHFSGTWLEETVAVSDDKEVPRYPIQFNVYRLPVMLHASFLFGEVPDSSDPLVKSVVEVRGNQVTEDAVDQDLRKPSQRSIEAGQRMTDYLNEVWYQNDGRAKQLEAGIYTQIYGGCVLGTAYDPNRPDYDYPVRIDHLHPAYFFPVWAPNDAFNLVEVIVAYWISKIQAKALYKIDTKDDRAVYWEKWSRDRYEITVDGETVIWNGVPLEGTPLGNFVPYTYIPHPPRVGQFYGESLLKSKLGLAKEINSRMVDLGDIVAEEARRIPGIANSKGVTVRRASGRLNYLDLGSTMPGQDEPKIVYPPASGAASNSSVTYVMDLINTARSEAYTPPIVYGLDEGSQRSALTLALRMMPLIAHIRDERTYWDTGLTQVDRQLLVCAAEKSLNGITMEMVRKAHIHHQWAPMLPRDAEQELNQLLLRLEAHTISPETVMEKLGDIPDIQGERKLILQWLKDLAEAEGPQLGMANQGPKGGAMGEQAGISKPKQPQANIKRTE